MLDEVLEKMLPEAFAVVRETGRRVLNMRHFDVQLMGGAALHFNKISEMRTGEGKTLVATLPVYLNRIDRSRRARRHSQRLSRQAGFRVDGANLQVSGSDRWFGLFTPTGRRKYARPTAATSATAPTTSSDSTICCDKCAQVARPAGATLLITLR